MSEIDVENYAAQPWVATASDGGIGWPGDGPVHPRFYGTFPRKIRHYALTVGALSLESAIRAQTSLPARIMGLADRGEIREGNWADLVVFDLETIADQATFVEPHQHATDRPCAVTASSWSDGEIPMTLPGRVIASRKVRGEFPARTGASETLAGLWRSDRPHVMDWARPRVRPDLPSSEGLQESISRPHRVHGATPSQRTCHGFLRAWGVSAPVAHRQSFRARWTDSGARSLSGRRGEEVEESIVPRSRTAPVVEG